AAHRGERAVGNDPGIGPAPGAVMHRCACFRVLRVRPPDVDRERLHGSLTIAASHRAWQAEAGPRPHIAIRFLRDKPWRAGPYMNFPRLSSVALWSLLSLDNAMPQLRAMGDGRPNT